VGSTAAKWGFVAWGAALGAGCSLSEAPVTDAGARDASNLSMEGGVSAADGSIGPQMCRFEPCPEGSLRDFRYRTTCTDPGGWWIQDLGCEPAVLCGECPPGHCCGALLDWWWVTTQVPWWTATPEHGSAMELRMSIFTSVTKETSGRDRRKGSREPASRLT